MQEECKEPRPTPEILAELRARVTRVCDNCQGSCRVGGRKTVEDVGRWPCPECHKGAPGRTSDPAVLVEEVIALIDEIELLQKKLQPGHCDLCGCDCGGCVVCDECGGPLAPRTE